MLFIYTSSAFLGGQKLIFHQESIYFLFDNYKNLYLFQTNIGHCCVYFYVVQYNYSDSKKCLFGFYEMLFMGDKKYLFYFIVCVPVRKELKPELYFYAQFLSI